MESETDKWRHPSIIAMKGHPFTGKSSIAREIAMFLRYCTLIQWDDILDSITLTKSLDDDEAAAMPSQLQEELVEQGFEFLLKVAETQLRLGVSVVIDSPLSSPEHLQRLIELINSTSPSWGTRGLIVVECKADKMYDWEMRFEEEYVNKNKNKKLKWYKPKCWGDIEKIIQRDTLNNSKNYPCPPGVCWLVLHVDQEVNVREAFQLMREMNQQHHILNGESRLVVYKQYVSEKKIKIKMEEGPHLKHSVCVFHEKGLIMTSTTTNSHTHNYDCWVCENPVVPGVDPAYTCPSQSCSLVLHQACAELTDNYDTADDHEKKKKIVNMIPNSNYSNSSITIIVRSRWEIIPQRFPHFLIANGHHYMYSFPAKYQCFECKEKGEGFSYDCVFCLFETHLKCRLIPTILRHEGHNKNKEKEDDQEDHLLFLDLNTVRHSNSQSHIYRCSACGFSSLSSTSGNYSCSYRCTAPGCHATRFHPQCLMLPRSELHHHSGYQHLVKLHFSRGEEFDEYLCDLCCDKMSPDSWFYYCEECDLTFHLNCLNFTDYTN